MTMLEILRCDKQKDGAISAAINSKKDVHAATTCLSLSLSFISSVE